MVGNTELMQKTIQQNWFNHFPKNIQFLHVLLYLFLIMQTNFALAEVTAYTARTVLSIDETFVLEIKSENNSGDPDITELEDSFQIMGRSQSQNYSLINGHASRTHSWNITLLPKRTGEITIPAIKVGNETTKAIHLVIKKQSTTPAIDGKQVFVKMSLAEVGEESGEKKPYYVQQQIIVTIKLFHRIRFSNATLSELELPNTVIEKIGNDANYTKNISNHRYNIIERKYAIYPQQSGELTIPSITFTGHAEISQNFSLFSRPGRQIISRTKPLTLDILPIPETYTGKIWLPAENLQIESEIIEDTQSITTGEAITRRIIIRAKGLLGSQLPATTVLSSNRIKSYPDKEKLSNQLVNGQVVGIRQDTIAIIPLKSGPFTLPEIKIDWWNTQTNQQETTRLAAQTYIAQKANANAVDAIPEAKSPTKTAPASMVEKKQSVVPHSEPQTTKTVEKIVYKEVSFNKNLWFWISAALLVLWLITVLLYLAAASKRKKISHQTLNNKPDNKHHNNYLQSVYNACLENNTSETTKALILWAKHYYKQPMLSGLSAIIQLVDDKQLIQAINELESSQYSQDKQSWEGRALIEALKHCIEQNKSDVDNKTPQAFSDLNPTQ